MSIYAIGDLHLSFAPEVEKPMDLFGHAWNDHAERLKKNWLEIVKPEDTDAKRLLQITDEID